MFFNKVFGIFSNKYGYLMIKISEYFVEYFGIPGDQPLAKYPEDSGYEIVPKYPPLRASRPGENKF